MGMLTIATTYCGYQGLKHSYTYSLDRAFKTADDLYLPTYVHFGSYAVGALTGIYLSMIEQNWKINKVQETTSEVTS